MYQPFNPLTLGVGYVEGERQFVDQQKAIDQHIEMMSKYDF